MKRIGAILVLVIAFFIAWYDYVFNEGALLSFLEGYLVVVLLLSLLLGAIGIVGFRRVRP